MDESSDGQEIASAMGNILRSLSEAGYEVRRVAPPGTAPQPLDHFEELVTYSQLRQVSGSLFRDRHYARAVEEAFKFLNNAVKEKSEIVNQDGAGLMRSAFSANSPVLYLNAFQSQSERDEQIGYMDLFAGSMTGIRNPRAHDHQLTDAPDIALELLVLANHLMRKLYSSTKMNPEEPE